MIKISCLLQQNICLFLHKFPQNFEQYDTSFESSENMELKVYILFLLYIYLYNVQNLSALKLHKSWITTTILWVLSEIKKRNWIICFGYISERSIMRGATTTNLIFSLSRYTIIDIEIKFRERGMLCNDKHKNQHFINYFYEN